MECNKQLPPLARAQEFASSLGIRLPILLAPMAGACPPSLSIAVANAGGLGGCGAVLMKPPEITAWCDEFRQHSQGAFQINLWIPEPEIRHDPALEERQRAFLAHWGPAVDASAGEGVLPDFEAQFQTILDAKPKVISSIMGLYSERQVTEMKARGILWFATATTAAEARAAKNSRRGRHPRTRNGSRWPSRSLQGTRGRTADRGPVRSCSADRGFSFASGDCSGRHR